jgi:hypothetical protein
MHSRHSSIHVCFQRLLAPANCIHVHIPDPAGAAQCCSQAAAATAHKPQQQKCSRRAPLAVDVGLALLDMQICIHGTAASMFGYPKSCSHYLYTYACSCRRRAVLQPSSNGNCSHAAAEEQPQGPCCSWPSWQSKVQKTVKRRHDIKAPTMDGEEAPNTSFTLRGLVH